MSIHVAIYKAPSKVELAHCAIYVRDRTGNDMIFQVIGGDGEDFEFNEKATDPMRSQSFASSTNVTYNLSESVEEVRGILKKTTVDNDDTSFNCQQFVFNCLNDLLDVGVISRTEQLTAMNALTSKKGVKGSTIFVCSVLINTGWAYEPY